MWSFAKRNWKEMVRDPVNMTLGLGFPLIVLLLLWFINRSIPAEAELDLFQLEKLTPGIAVFGYSFIALFSATLISRDRGTAFLPRLFSSPLGPWDYILGYTLPMLPLAIGQTIVCYIASILLGLHVTWSILPSIGALLPCAVMNIAIGLLLGSLLNDKQVGGVCGALLTNLSAWLSGTWFSLDLIGGAFETAAYCLPFAHAVDAGRLALSGSGAGLAGHLAVVCAYALGLSVLAVLAFRRKMAD